ncbi:MAG: nuclear transport factor 2 family protein [Planctomycetota bacterium]
MHPSVAAFIDCINRQDVDGLCRLMTADHLFVDGGGQEVRGREVMREGWRAYFGMVPDYRLTIADCVECGPVTAMFGRAGGTYSPDGRVLPHNRWETPAAWKAVVRDDLVAEWRVFADNEPIRRVMRTAPA